MAYVEKKIHDDIISVVFIIFVTVIIITGLSGDTFRKKIRGPFY